MKGTVTADGRKAVLGVEMGTLTGRFAAATGLHSTDVRALWVLAEAGAPRTAGELGARLALSNAAVTRTVDRLEAEGYVERVRDADDRRRVGLRLTAEAEEVAGAFFGRTAPVVGEAIEEFADGELEVASRFLARVHDALRTHGDNDRTSVPPQQLRVPGPVRRGVRLPQAAAEPVPYDYDDNPDRMRLARSVLSRHAVGETGDVHEPVAQRFIAEGVARVLDVGCGEGELARYLPDDVWVGLDNSRTMLEGAPSGGVRGDATALPFPDESFDAVAILYVLYHLADPRLALAEAHRVMRPGGLIAVAVPSRYDSPELAHALPTTSLTFDAELAPDLLRELFEDTEVKRWDAPLIELPTVRGVRDYLVGKQVSSERAQAVAETVDLPLSVTKRGALLFACKRT